MKRILIIPATAALLTGLSATAQDFNENPDTVNTPAQVLYTGDEANLDEMTIEQLNALQLQRLQTAGDETAASGESTFQVARLTSDDGSDDLANLLKRHVVEGNYKAADITQGETELMTLAGTNLAIERAGDMITADHVDVVSGDIKASNGVIHAIDMVIVPMIETEADVEANTDLETGIDPLGQ